MSITPLRQPTASAPRLQKAVVLGIDDDGTVDVQTLRHRERFTCEVLHPVGAVAQGLLPGDRILVAPPEEGDTRGTILGRLGPPRTPAVLRFEAGQEIHLECGPGSIRLRADGRVVVRGLEVASIAEGVNRIKGGSVEVN